MNDATSLAEDRLRDRLDERASVLTVVTPPLDVITRRARARQRRHTTVVAAVMVMLLAGGVAFVVGHAGGTGLSTRVPRSGESTTLPPNVDPDVTHVVLDGFATIYYVDEPSHSASTPDYVEYQWTQAATHRNLQLSFYPASKRFEVGSSAAGTMPGGGRPVPIRGTTGALTDEGASRYRVDWSEAGRDWEADGGGYASVQAFLDTVASIHRTDRATWLASLPAGTVSVSARPGAVDALLAGVPVPGSVDVAALRTAPRSASAYDLAFDVYGQVECGWIAQLDAHRGSPDGQKAALALGTIKRWPGMRTLDAQGGAGEVFRTTAKSAVEGDTQGYRSALGC